MAEEVKEILESWNIPNEIINNFSDNNITVDHFASLDDALLKELCPSIGTRIQLKNDLLEFIARRDSGADTETIYTDSTGTTDGGLDRITERIQEENLPGPSWQNEENANPSTDFPLGLEDIEETLLHLIRPPLPEFDLKTLLQTSPLGNSVIQFYSVNGSLDQKRRTRLVDIVVKHIFNYIVKYRLRFDDYKILAAKIVALFPKENIGTYFVSPIKKSLSVKGKPVFAKGKLVDKCRNLLYISGEKRTNKKRPLQENSNLTAEENEIGGKKQKLEELHTKNILWLKVNQEPWNTVIVKWESTFDVRQAAEYISVDDFLKSWPILLDLRGEVLLNLDFNRIYPEKGTLFFGQWQTFFNKILEIRKKDLPSNDPYISALLDSLDSIGDNDSKIATQITLLPHLIPPKGRTVIDKKISHQNLSLSDGLFT